jgi:hypothetical protein
MQFLDRQGIINLSQEFSEKNLHAISYSFQSDSVHEFESE